jgi:hypothetical protein
LAPIDYQAFAGAERAWREAEERLRAWLAGPRDGRGLALVVADRAESAAALAERCASGSVFGIGLRQLETRLLRRGALSAGLPAGFVLLGAPASKELDRRSARRAAERLLGKRDRDAAVREALRHVPGLSRLVDHPVIAPRVTRRQRSARLSRGTLAAGDLEWAIRRLERQRPDLLDATLKGVGLIVALLGAASCARWRPRLERLVAEPEPVAVWLAELTAPVPGRGGRPGHQTPAVQELEQLAAALEEPADALAVVGVLRSRLFGLSDESLVRHRRLGGDWCPRRATQPSALPGDPAVIEALDQLARWADAAAERGTVPALESAIDQLDQRRLLLELAGGEEEAEALASALDHLQEREVAPLPDARPRASVLSALRRSGELAASAEVAAADEPAPTRWPAGPGGEALAVTAGASLSPGPAAGPDFELLVSRQALEQLTARAPDDPGDAAELVEGVLRLTGRGQEDALRASGIVRGLWEHPLLLRARQADRVRTGLGMHWIESERDSSTRTRLVRGVLDLWFEDSAGRVVALCDSGPWRDPEGPRRRLEARRGDLSRIATWLDGPFAAHEGWLLLVGGPQVVAERSF